MSLRQVTLSVAAGCVGLLVRLPEFVRMRVLQWCRCSAAIRLRLECNTGIRLRNEVQRRTGLGSLASTGFGALHLHALQFSFFFFFCASSRGPAAHLAAPPRDASPPTNLASSLPLPGSTRPTVASSEFAARTSPAHGLTSVLHPEEVSFHSFSSKTSQNILTCHLAPPLYTTAYPPAGLRQLSRHSFHHRRGPQQRPAVCGLQPR